jgi:hypothetical protein
MDRTASAGRRRIFQPF